MSEFASRCRLPACLPASPPAVREKNRKKDPRDPANESTRPVQDRTKTEGDEEDGGKREREEGEGEGSSAPTCSMVPPLRRRTKKEKEKKKRINCPAPSIPTLIPPSIRSRIGYAIRNRTHVAHGGDSPPLVVYPGAVFGTGLVSMGLAGRRYVYSLHES